MYVHVHVRTYVRIRQCIRIIIYYTYMSVYVEARESGELAAGYGHLVKHRNARPNRTTPIYIKSWYTVCSDPSNLYYLQALLWAGRPV